MKLSSNQETSGRGRGIFVIAFRLALLILPISSLAAAQGSKIPRVGYLSVSGAPNRPGRYVEAFRQGLREHGYDEGKNILVEYRYTAAAPEKVPEYVSELVQAKVDALVISSTGALREARQATKTIPIIMIAPFDPVEAGIIDSLARPGGNITGMSRLGRELSGKRLEVFAELVPGLWRVGVLAAEGRNTFRDYAPAARALKMTVESLDVNTPNPDLEAVFQTATKARLNGVIIHGSRSINVYQKQIVELANKNRLPSMFEVSGWVESGGFASYSADDIATFRRAAIYVDKIFKGAKPGDLPVEQPTKFELVINLKTANQIGLSIPPNVLARADKVIR